MANLTTAQVWAEIENQMFGIVGMVSAKNEARTAGIVYIVRDHKLYFGTAKAEWKTRHIAQNQNVSMTIPIAKRIPFMPWIKIPQATITFAGVANVMGSDEAPAEIVQTLHADISGVDHETTIIEITPVKEFVTYGVGVSLQTMRDTVKARGRVAVA